MCVRVNTVAPRTWIYYQWILEVMNSEILQRPVQDLIGFVLLAIQPPKRQLQVGFIEGLTDLIYH